MATALTRMSSERKDIHVDIYESAREFAEIGAGIGIWPRGWEVIRSLGLEDDLRAVATVTGKPVNLTSIRVIIIEFMILFPLRSDGFEYRKSDQAQGVSFYESTSRGIVNLTTDHAC